MVGFALFTHESTRIWMEHLEERMRSQIETRPADDARPLSFWKKTCTWQTLMAVFVVYEMLAFCARHYDTFYIDRLWPQIGLPLTVAFAAVALSKAGVRKRPGMGWLIAYFFWYLAVLIINRWYLAYEFASFRLVLYRLLFTTLVCYPLGCELAEDAGRRMARAVFGTLTGGLAVMSAVGFFCVVFQTHWYAPYEHGAVGLLAEEYTGFRLYLFAHPNMAGAALMMSMLLCVYLWLTAKCRGAKGWHGLCFVFHFLALALTVSRTSMLAASVGIALLPFLWAYDRTRASRPRLSWLAGIACAGLAAVICYAGLSLAHWGTMQFARMPAASAETSAIESVDDQALEADALADFPAQRDQLTYLENLTGRTVIWSAALRTIAAYPTLLIKGATLERLMLTVESQAPEIKGFLHLHNAYLTVLIGMGLPALLLLLGFLILLARYSWRLMMCSGASLGQRFLPAILLGSLIVGMAEPFYFTGQYFMDRLFFLVAGFVVTASIKRPSHTM